MYHFHKSTKKKHPWFAKLLDIIINNMDHDNFSIKELSEALFMSTSNVNRKVKKLLGLSTSELIKKIRLQKAAELLNVYNFSVADTCYATGFYDVSHLSRSFKPIFNCSPGDYRNISPFYECVEPLKQGLTKEIIK